MGRPGKSPTQEWLTGRASQAKSRDGVQVIAETPRCPTHLSEVARAKWREVVAILKGRGVLCKGDALAIEIYCESYSRWRQCLDEVQADGVLVEQTVMDSSGVPHSKKVLNPAARAATALENSLRAMLRELCSTVSSRSKVEATEPPENQNPLPPDSVGALYPELFKKGNNNAS